MEESEKSVVFKGFPHCRIANGLNSSVYRRLNKAFSRELLGLPLNKKVILFVADSIKDKRKGYEYLLNAVKNLGDRMKLCFAQLGQVNADQIRTSNLHQLGAIYNEELMCAAYSSADVFVIPSIEDNLPNTVLESLMCGTPVIGFPIGGITDMIEEGKNGYLSKDVSENGLLDAINTYLTSTLEKTMMK